MTPTAKISLIAGLLSILSACKSIKIPSSASIRHLEDVEANFDYDLSGYSVRFGKCQHVKTFSDELAQDEDSSTVLALKYFVLFRMCPSDQCSSCDYNYGEYVVEINQYLQNMAEFSIDKFERQCEDCDDGCVNTDDVDVDFVTDGDVTCNFCNDCDIYENMEDYGYVDATDYMECQQIEMANDDGNNGDDDLVLYVGSRCSSDGSKIVLDVFSDENCWERYEDGPDLETLLGKQISYRFLKESYSSVADDCVSCKEGSYFDDDEDNQDEDNVFEMCENIYEVSAKCETKHGFINGYVKQNGYENQVLNEYEVCTFIDSLVWGSYDETGEINVGATQDVIVRYVTSLQKTALILLSTTLVGIGVLAYYLHTVIDSITPVTLESQGGTLA